MIELYTQGTPNGHKVSIMLEELGYEYRTHVIDIGAGDQFEESFLKLSPNNKIPAIVDRDGYGGKETKVFESGAILLYLAEKSGRFLPGIGKGGGGKVGGEKERMEVLQWLFFQMGGVGPMLGQAHHFRRFASEEVPYGIERYTKEAERLYGVVDRRLSESEYLGGGEYSIADMATFPWMRAGIEAPEHQGVEGAKYKHYKRWYDLVSAREGVKRGLEVPKN